MGRGGSTTITFVAKQLNHGLSLPTKQSGLALAIHLPNESTKLLLFHEEAFANRTIRLSNRTNLHFRHILPPELERSLPRQLFENAVEGLV